MATSSWSESAHPRVPAGSPQGGEFTSKAGTGFSFPKEEDGETFMSEAEVREVTRTKWNDEHSREDIARLCGAQPGSRVKIYPVGATELEVAIDFMGDDGFPIGHARRGIDGNQIYNEELELGRAFKGKGRGLTIFTQQVDEAVRRGYRSIETEAAGNPDMREHQNGYYTWARLGYNGEVEGPRGTTTVHELMSTPNGAKWWKMNGHSFLGSFDLSEGSNSRRMLDEYRRLKGLPSMEAGYRDEV